MLVRDACPTSHSKSKRMKSCHFVRVLRQTNYVYCRKCEFNIPRTFCDSDIYCRKSEVQLSKTTLSQENPCNCETSIKKNCVTKNHEYTMKRNHEPQKKQYLAQVKGKAGEVNALNRSYIKLLNGDERTKLKPTYQLLTYNSGRLDLVRIDNTLIYSQTYA